ncbi:Metallo-dependent phosphatase [Exidia glandulosa HHB12029]|uniref:Metallo-dependent phosphatase n=1 Tax=Exidia glandulosa HHB12029 TaxID=1314781 RepID=A0A166BBE5_EXIGL|nr:Metallo-dependent phosphatase [Exidia glandulosa HHB12029]
MRSSGVAAVALATASLLAAPCAAKVDRLVSSRLSKRGLDSEGLYNVTILHTNDVHAHLDEWRAGRGTDCTEGSECIAGYARIKDKINEIRKEVPDAIVLDDGDEFQGTLFFAYYGGEKISYAVNEVGYDALTLGNHEFDKGLDELTHFLGNLTFPVVCANLKTNHTGMNALKNWKPYTIIERHNVGIVGLLTPDTKGTSSGAGPGTDISDPAEALTAAVAELEAKGVNRIIALTHIGYDKDIELAQKTRGIDLIVGGHSHTLIGDMEGAAGKYPTIAKNLDGEEVFIVTAYRWGEYLGKISLAFDESGKAVKYEGEPIRLSNTTAQDSKLDGEVAEWRKPFDELAKKVVGKSDVVLDQSTCQKQECTLGDVITDAMYEYRVAAGGKVDGAIINAGGIRATISQGDVTQGDVLNAFPFLNAVTDLTFTGAELWDVFEGIASASSNVSKHEVTSFVQVSSTLQMTWNPSNPVGSRLIDFKVGGQTLDKSKTYTITAVDFLATGGDYFWAPRTDFIALDTLDQILVAYFDKHNPVQAKVASRIVQTTATSPTTGGSDGTGAASVRAALSTAGAVLAVCVAGVALL